MNTEIKIETNTANQQIIDDISIPLTTIFIKEDSNGVSQWNENTQIWVKINK